MTLIETINRLEQMIIDGAQICEQRQLLITMREQLEAYDNDAAERTKAKESSAESERKMQSDNRALLEENAKLKHPSPQQSQHCGGLSENAKRLLCEIEACYVSAPKGVSILRVTETTGDYLPHLYPTPEPSHVRCVDLNDVIQAVDELVKAGWLEPHAVENKVEEFRRTLRAIPL